MKYILAIALMLISGPALAARCALVDSANAILEWQTTPDVNCPPDPTGKGWDWRPAPEVAAPAYDDATQVLEGPFYTVDPTQVVESWTVRAKTALELSDDLTRLQEMRAKARLATGIRVFTANVTIGAVSGSTVTEKTFTVSGLKAGDYILSLTFNAGLSPATIANVPVMVSADDTLVMRFIKPSSGNVTPPANQAITVVVLRQ